MLAVRRYKRLPGGPYAKVQPLVVRAQPGMALFLVRRQAGCKQILLVGELRWGRRVDNLGRDKLEKANYFLEQIIDTADLDLDSRLVQTLVQAPLSDGGQWDMVYNLVAKYGLGTALRPLYNTLFAADATTPSPPGSLPGLF